MSDSSSTPSPQSDQNTSPPDSISSRINPFNNDKDNNNELQFYMDMSIDRSASALSNESQDKDTAETSETPPPQYGPSGLPLPSVLSKGLLKHYMPELEPSKKCLEMILVKQSIMNDKLSKENRKYTEVEGIRELQVKMSRVKVYHERLVSIRRQMTSLHERSTALKRRATAVQAEKQKEALARESKRDRDREREKRLTAKEAPSS